MNRLFYVMDRVLFYYRSHGELPGQIDMNPVFLLKLEQEISLERKKQDIVDYAVYPVSPIEYARPALGLEPALKFYGIPVYKTETTHSIQLHSKAARDY